MSDPRIDHLLSVWQDRRRAGTPSPPEDLCRDAPELLPEVRAAIAAIERVERLAGDTTPHDSPADTATHAPAATAPRRLGDFVVVGVLGRGGMGEVLLADDPRLGRRVAVKVMRPGLAADPGARERFLREARSAAAVRHEHVVPIYHVGEDAGTPYLVMPLLEGETLAARLGRGPLSPAEVARVGREVAEGLAAAHAKGLVHRDVKPANIWLESPGDRVRLLDFGLARSEAGADGLTQPGAVLGTAAYMSPEQADGLAVDGRSDLFSLGAVLYHATTGRPPFDGKSLTAVLRAVAGHHPPPPRELNPAVPPGLSDLILRLLSKTPGGRPASAEAVSAELGGDVAVEPPTRTRPRLSAELRAGRARNQPLAVGCTVAVTLCLVVAVALPLAVWPLARDVAQVIPTNNSAGPITAATGEGTRPTQPVSTKSVPTGSTLPLPKSAGYRGSVDLLIHRVDADGSDIAVPLSDPRAMPLRTGDHFKVVAEVDPPAFVYLVWIDETGAATPLYPWADRAWNRRPPDEKPVPRMEVKSPDGNWLRLSGEGPGMETVLMLARPDPLAAAPEGVRAWFEKLRPPALKGEKALTWFENFDLVRNDPTRGFEYGGYATDPDSPLALQRELRVRIADSASYSRAVSFARLESFDRVSRNNLRKIGQALHMYHDAHNAFPTAAVRDKSGKPLLSWRVAVLPYLGRDDLGNLYRRFKLDEPWDSEHNKTLIPLIPDEYVLPGPAGGRAAGATHYLAFVGPNAALDRDKGTRMAGFADGTSNTLLLAEAAAPVVWTKPEDFAYDLDRLPPVPPDQLAGKRLPDVGFPFGDRCNVCLADGTATSIRKGLDKKYWHYLIGRSDGQDFPREVVFDRPPAPAGKP